MKFNGIDQLEQGAITKAELSNAWHTHVEDYKSTEIDPIVEQLKQAKADYIATLKSFYQKVDSFNKVNRDNRFREYGLHISATPIDISPFNTPDAFITAEEIGKIERKRSI